MPPIRNRFPTIAWLAAQVAKQRATHDRRRNKHADEDSQAGKQFPALVSEDLTDAHVPSVAAKRANYGPWILLT